MLPSEMHEKVREFVFCDDSVIHEHKYDLLGRNCLNDAEVAAVTRCYISKRVKQETSEEFAVLYINFRWEENGVIKEAYLQERVSKDGELMAGCKVDPSYVGKFSIGDTDVDPGKICVETRRFKETGVIYKRATFVDREKFIAGCTNKL